MQRITLLCVGKLKERFYAEAAAEYAKRLGRYCRLDLVELPEERLPEAPSPAQVGAALAREAEAIRGKLPPSSSLIALCVEGRERSSEELARLLAGWVPRASCLHQGPGPGEAVHVPHDLSPPPGPGDAAGADLPGLSDQRGDEIP